MHNLKVSLLAMVLAVGSNSAFAAPPPGVPNEYVPTPFGWYHPSCVVELATSDGTVATPLLDLESDVGDCDYAHFTLKSAIDTDSLPPPSAADGWDAAAAIVFASNIWTTWVSGDWGVPSEPLDQKGQLIYIFNGMENGGNPNIILQPVLRWVGDGSHWTMANWAVQGKSKLAKSSDQRVYPGDIIGGYVYGNGSGNYSVAYNLNGAYGNSLSVVVPTDNPMSIAIGGTIETYGVNNCNELPATNVGFSGVEILTAPAGGIPVRATPGWNWFPLNTDAPYCFNSGSITISPTSVWLQWTN
jgi:hypothetical protein